MEFKVKAVQKALNSSVGIKYSNYTAVKIRYLKTHILIIYNKFYKQQKMRNFYNCCFRIRIESSRSCQKQILRKEKSLLKEEMMPQENPITNSAHKLIL